MGNDGHSGRRMNWPRRLGCVLFPVLKDRPPAGPVLGALSRATACRCSRQIPCSVEKEY